MLVDPALSGLPAFLTPKPGLEFRLHDPAGDGRGAGLGKQAARLSRQRRFDPDLGQPGGSCLDGGAWRAPAAADDRKRQRRDRRSSCWPRRRAATSTRRSRRANRWRLCAAWCARRFPISTTIAISIPTWKRRSRLVRSGAAIAVVGAVGLPGVHGGCGVNGRFSDNRIFGHPIIFRDRLFSRPCKEENFRFGFPIGGPMSLGTDVQARPSRRALELRKGCNNF